MKKVNNKRNTILKTLQTYVGKTGQIEIDGLTFEVQVRDVDLAYGHKLVEIAPKKGVGRKWVRADRLMQLA